MPTGAKIYIRLRTALDLESLRSLRNEFMQAMAFNDDDFYSQGPLMVLPEEERPYMPVKDKCSVWLDVNLWRSYYGIGYERGDIKLFVKCAEWLEQRLPSCEIYYGHDIDDENISLFDKTSRDKLMKHYMRNR